METTKSDQKNVASMELQCNNNNNNNIDFQLIDTNCMSNGKHSKADEEEFCRENANLQTETRRNNFIVEYFKRKCNSWNRNQFVTLLILSCVEFFAAAVVSIQAPFYPDVARKKGASSSEYGFVFGIFELTVFIMSPIYGSTMNYLKPRRVFNWGILITGICCIIFGFLDQIEGSTLFIWSSLIVRIVEAMGDAAFDTASFTIIAMEFPKSIGTSFAILEICFGLGLIIGPSTGGLLYEIGGYPLPFLFMGTFLFVAAIATYIFLPEPGQRKKQDNGISCSSPDTPAVARGGFDIFKMLQIPEIAIAAYSIVAATAGVGFLSANLDYHLEQFHLSKLQVGLVFIMNGGVYAVTAPIWGFLCDHTDNQKLVTLTGAIFSILGFVLIGPVPYFPYDKNIPLICVGLALFGFGLAAALVSAFLSMLQDAIAHGYPDDISTYALVSGCWGSMSALGYFIGPSAGGIMADLWGFQTSSVLIIGAQLILIIIMCVHWCYVARAHVISKQHQLGPVTSGAKENNDVKPITPELITFQLSGD